MGFVSPRFGNFNSTFMGKKKEIEVGDVVRFTEKAKAEIPFAIKDDVGRDLRVTEVNGGSVYFVNEFTGVKGSSHGYWLEQKEVSHV